MSVWVDDVGHDGFDDVYVLWRQVNTATATNTVLLRSGNTSIEGGCVCSILSNMGAFPVPPGDARRRRRAHSAPARAGAFLTYRRTILLNVVRVEIRR
jgi:hypothetical protein